MEPDESVQRLHIDEDGAIEECVRVLNAGGLVALPTETVYGLAVKRGAGEDKLRAFKCRENKPFQILIHEQAEAVRLGAEVSLAAKRLMAMFWPGPLTLVLRAGEETVGVRMPDLPFVQEVIRRLGAPLTATSANRAGEVPATTADGVLEYDNGEVDLLIDGGTVKIGTASTVVKVVGEQVEILREGAISAEKIQGV